MAFSSDPEYKLNAETGTGPVRRIRNNGKINRMLDEMPKESQRRSWSYVAAGVLVVYATIPLARALREAVDASIGREAFLYLTLFLGAAGALAAFANLRRRRLTADAYIWLAVLVATFAFFLYRLRNIPEEAIHVAEYGALGLLVYRALLHRVRDFTIYFAAMLIVGMIGILDEYIQWAVPSRYYDLRDIGTNFAAGFLSQLTLLAGLRPRLVGGPPTPRSLRRLCRLSAATLLLMCVAFVNTPPRVGWYSAKLPRLGFLAEGNSNMAEYGYRFETDATGVFRSRFSAAELRFLDGERGADVAGILDRYIGGIGYRPFLSEYNVIRDPYAHEAGVHLFRRESHLERARNDADNPQAHYHIAYRENKILENFYGNAIKLSRHHWSPSIEDEVSRISPRNLSYESPVSASLITGLREWQVMALFTVAIAGFVLAGRVAGSMRDVASEENTS